jgi:DNA gyrase subunit A
MAQKRERVVPRLIEEEIRESFLDYSMSVIVQRALPDVRDGLKPVHRRILHAMNELGLRPDRPYKKSASVVGEVLGKFHPHGDSAVYDAMVRMVQDFSLRYPLVDGQGNYGSVDGDSAAAYRYTEARLSPIATELLDEIDRDTVDFIPNFDGQREEPTVLPSRLPNLLLNGSSGIAVGMSTNIPPHNLREVAAAVHILLADPDCSIEDLTAVVKGPDFPTAGFIVGSDGIRDMYATGRGRVVMRARIVKEVLRGGKEQLVVTELPYATSKSRIIEQIADLHRKGKLDDVSDIRDESDRDGMRLVIELKRSGNPVEALRTLFRRTGLQGTFGAIMLALDRGEPKEFNLKQLLERYRDHRMTVIQRRSRHELERAEAERHVVQGLLVALDHIDEVVALIRGSNTRGEASEKLQSRFGLSEIQADAILNMRLSRLTRLQRDELQARLDELEARIAELREILGSEERQKAVLLAELDELVERYGDARRTVILGDALEDEAAVEDAVADEDAVVLVSHEGFAQRMPVHLYRRRVTSGKALAGMDRFEDDYLERVFTARTRGWILAFTEGGKVHFLPVLEVPEVARASRGQSVYALAGAPREDRIVALLPVEELDAERQVVFLTAGGQVKRTALSEYSNPRAGGIIAAGVKEGDRILDVVLSDGHSELMLLSRDGRSIRFPESDVPLMGRTAQGVKGMGLRDDDRIVGGLLLRREAEVLTVTERGIGRRTEVAEFPLQHRGGLGTLAGSGGSGKPEPVVAALEVLETETIMVITAAGAVTRVPVAEIPRQGRRGKGSPIVDLLPGDVVAEVTRSQGEDGDGDGNGGGEGPGPEGDDEALAMDGSEGVTVAAGEAGPGEEMEAGEPSGVPEAGGGGETIAAAPAPAAHPEPPVGEPTPPAREVPGSQTPGQASQLDLLG